MSRSLGLFRPPTIVLKAEFSRVLMLNAEPPLIPENQQVSQELVAAHELVRGLIAKLQR